jgi:FkbH-like protein
VIVIAATFVAEPLEVPLAWLLREAGLAETLVFAPYNQVFQQLLDPDSVTASNAAGVNVLLIRLEDFIRDEADTTRAAAILERAAAELLDVLTEHTRRANGTTLLAILAPTPQSTAQLDALLVQLSEAALQHARTLNGLKLLQDSELADLSGPDRTDAARNNLAHIPYTDEYFAAIALAITRKIHAVKVPAAKVLVLDCDNTIWSGVVGEDGIDGVLISPPFLALQEFAVAQHAKGVLVCLASKNVDSDVLQLFEQRADMHLRLDHVVAHRINWEPKASNVRSLATELNLGLDAFVFLDDNPVECAQMRAALPQVVTLQLPPEPQIADFLAHLWCFDKLTVTAEDAVRTQMYRQNSARLAMESTVGDIAQFISALEIKIDIATPGRDEWARVGQLTQRTNQFNTTTRRRTDQAVMALEAEGVRVFRVRVSDRFGDYGLVGALFVAQSESGLTVDNFLLSCRVLGRGVEHAMLRHVGELALSHGLDCVSVLFAPTTRNIPAHAFLNSVAAQYAEPTADGVVYRIPAREAANLAHRPGHDPKEIIEARNADDKKSAASAVPGDSNAAIADRSARYMRLATQLTTGAAVLQQCTTDSYHSRPLDTPIRAPATDVETKLKQLWESLLSIDEVGVEDDFFALGGTSLLSVKLFADIERCFDAQLRLTAILEAPTIRQLARLIDHNPLRSGLVSLRVGGPKNFFLVHDGLGETLLYLHFARRMPGNLTVYGIEPRELPGIPLAHASIEEMASFYVEQIRKVQPHGPYLLGGMCAGGLIAYEMAACLHRSGEPVELVAIMDGATPQAAKRVGRVARQRLSRLDSLLRRGAGEKSGRIAQWASLTQVIIRKATNLVIYEATAVVRRASVRLRLNLLSYAVRRNAAWPALVPRLSVMEIYNALEARYTPPPLGNVPVLLVRASSGEGTDTPYRSVYRDEDFGWSHVATTLQLADVVGGHSSMLQEHAVDSLVNAIADHIADLQTTAARHPA